MKSSKLLGHFETKHPALRDKPLNANNQISALRASYLDCIAKAKKALHYRGRNDIEKQKQAFQVDKSTDMDNKALLVVHV